jgi:apolipoprotein N-acyltransferase
MTTASIALERRRWAIAVAAAFASGALLWAASPAGGLGWAAWVALTPAALVAFQYPDTRAGRLALPLAFGISLELLLVPALPFGLAEDQWADEFILPIMVGESPVLAVALVLVPLAVALLYALRFPFLGRPALLAGALGWTALDLLRTKFDPGGLFGELYATQHDTPLADVAALGGPWLLTFVIALGSLGLARLAFPALILAAAIAVAALLAIPEPGNPQFELAAVQPGYDTADFDRPLLRFHHARRYAESARVLVRDLELLEPGADVVVWPEAAIWVPPGEVKLERAPGNLVLPFFLRGPDEGGAVVAGPDRTLSRTEPKHRPMWFVGEQGKPDEPRPIRNIGTMLGVDTQDAAVARELAIAGALVLTSSTHDWEQLVPHHRAHEQIASAAVGRPLVRADWRYGSAVFDRGTVVADAGPGKRRTVVTGLVAGPHDTPYVRIGDALGWAAVASAGLLAVLRWRASGG